MNRYIAIISLTLISSYALADVWELPKTKRYFSKDSTFMVKVIPTQIPEKYWQWTKSKPNKKKNFTEKDTTIILCHAILYKIESPDTIEIWNKKIVNPIMPVQVIVADDGKSTVTFDNWSSMGYGPDVMVIYNEFGELAKKYQLQDFSPFPITDYMTSVSSIWWRCGTKYINNQTIEICFQDQNKNTKTRQYNLTTQEFK